jgi:3-oxoacyl-[acyl-carrier-protein] synthase II
MTRQVVVTGLGTVTAAGIGVTPFWEAACAGRSAVERIDAFDPSGFECQVAGEVRDFKVNKIVPKSYRKATKVMARDIELAVGAADAAVRHAGIVTPGTDPDGERTYPGERCGAHIGAGLIAAELNELTGALVESRTDGGEFDLHHWGREGMMNLTPLWLLKYLPNMLACHVTIIHDAQGPSNTITCGEASGGLSIAESVRVIERRKADLCFCGGAESKINPMAFYRQQLTGRLTTTGNDQPTRAVRPFDAAAGGTVLGEGGGIVTIEALDTATARGAQAYAEILGFGSSMSQNAASGGLEPEPDGRGIASAVRQALMLAGLESDAIDAVVACGTGIHAYDHAEAAALRSVFGDRADGLPIWSAKPYVGNCGAGAGGIDLAIGAMMLRKQKLPATINCDEPIEGLGGAATGPARDARHRCSHEGQSFGQENLRELQGHPAQGRRARDLHEPEA